MSDSFRPPWTVACQAYMSSTISWSLLTFMSIELVMLSNHLILCQPFLLLPSIFPSTGSFPVSWLFTLGNQSIAGPASVLLVNMQDWFPLDWWFWSPCSPRDFQESSPELPYEGINSSALTQPSLWSNSHIRKWLLEKPWFWLYRSLLAKWCLCFLICYLGLS